MPQKRIIVTGGSGKAGHWIVKHLLEQDYEVINIDKSEPAGPICHTIHADLTDLGQVVNALSPYNTTCRAPYVGVIHMAAIPRAHVYTNEEVYRVNTLSTYNILEACAIHGIQKVVLASSESSYGLCFAGEFFEPQYLPVDEAHPQLPEDSYGLSKIVNEVCAAAFHRRTGMQVISLRLGNVLCPEDHARIISHFHEPENRRRILWSYIDSRDIAVACQLAIEKDGLGCEPIILTADDTSSNLESMDLIRRFLPGVNEFKKELPGRTSLMDNSRAKDLLGWQPRYRLKF